MTRHGPTVLLEDHGLPLISIGVADKLEGASGMGEWSVRSTWVNPEMLIDQPDAVGSILANRWVTYDPDVYLVIIGPRDKAAAFEARLFDYGPPDEAISDPESHP